MKIGAVFPQLEIGADPGAIRAYVEAVEDMEYSYILIYDHVLGADSVSRPGWNGYYDHKDMFHEIMVLFGYMAAISSKLELVTGVLVSPQRETALIAKQAAEVDILTGGKLRLGIGVGWNAVEFEALNQDFHNRGKRIEEQVAVMRELWTKEVVNFKGRWHTINAAGINPLPVQRPIPVWMGGKSDIVLRRIARMGDGWFPQYPPDATGRAEIEKLRAYVREAGRDPSSVGIDARLNMRNTPESKWAEEVQAWREIKVTHLHVNTMSAGFKKPDDHIKALRRLKHLVRL